jgi:hypothetical protein
MIREKGMEVRSKLQDKQQAKGFTYAENKDNE